MFFSAVAASLGFALPELRVLQAFLWVHARLRGTTTMGNEPFRTSFLCSLVTNGLCPAFGLSVSQGPSPPVGQKGPREEYPGGVPGARAGHLDGPERTWGLPMSVHGRPETGVRRGGRKVASLISPNRCQTRKTSWPNLLLPRAAHSQREQALQPAWCLGDSGSYSTLRPQAGSLRLWVKGGASAGGTPPPTHSRSWVSFSPTPV